MTVALMVVCLTGCGRKQNSNSRSPRDYQSWKLANGTEFSVTINSADKPTERSWIWCDLPNGDVSYRIVGGSEPGTWKSMMKITVSKDEKLTITPSVEGMYGDAVVLPAGQYKVEFKIGKQEFSSAALEVD